MKSMKTVYYEGYWKGNGSPSRGYEKTPVVSNDSWFLENKPLIIKSLEKIQSIIRSTGLKHESCSFCKMDLEVSDYVCMSQFNPKAMYGWSSQLIHYIREHNVCPSDNFLEDILGMERKRVETKSETIIRLLKELTDDERLDIFDNLFCKHCGSEKTLCYCMKND